MALLVAEIVLCFIGVVVTFNTLGNLRAYRPLNTFAREIPQPPFVSVLVPARNEERALGRCLESLCAQGYDAYEVIVLDDASTDRTAAIARAMAERSPHLHVISGAPLLPGWLGKAWACDQLARAARGEILLFTDADTEHAPEMLRSVIGAVRDGADVVTAFPEQEIGSWGEALVVPFMLFTIWTLLPVGRVWSDPSPQAAAANGQLLAFTRAAYETIGGHTAVRNAVLDDMGLARRAKRAGLRLRLADGVGTVRTRMYRNADETWRGFSKNAFSLVGDTIWGALGLSILLLALYIFPLAVAIAGFARGHEGWAWRWLPLALIGMMLIQRAVVVVRGRLPLWQVALQPVSVLAFVAILANSLRWHRRGYGEWKGRRFAMSADRSRGARE